ncbi:MAG TPA: threonylcarbamoyl-AMP synthase [Desulfobacteraceae bacterium]|nr:threonylcarbamoyl-AMP synthase [Desulfobacteraceae bacterium]
MHRSRISGRDIERAAAVVRGGGLIAFPTETYYGLGVDPFNERALQRLFTLKNRATVKPVLVLVGDRSQVNLLASRVPQTAHTLMDAFWPGPLTLVLPARADLSSLLTGGTATVGVRLSPHPDAVSLVRAFGAPLTATSANRAGEPAAVSAEEVYAFFGDRVDMILDGGRTPGVQASTLVGVGDDTVECIREGRIPFEEIRAALRPQAGRAAAGYKR